MTDAGELRDRRARPASQRLAIARWTLLILLAAWFSWPAWTSVHVEGFSANLQSMAILLHRHGPSGLALADQSYPVTTEYLYMSRSGLVDALQSLIRLTGHLGDGIFRALMLISMAVYCWAILALARRWSSEPYGALLAVLVLTPGLVEISFYYADNLPSAALAMLALALVQRDRTSILRWSCAGALFLAAVLMRADAMLLAPVLVLCVLRERRRISHLLAQAACLALGAAFVLLLAQGLTPFRLDDCLHIVPLFNTLHGSVRGHGREAIVAVGFFGLITPMLLLVGVVGNARARDWQWHLGLTIMPLLFYLYALPRALEVRMFLLLGAPAILVHGATGLRVLRTMWLSRHATSRWVVGTVGVLCLAVVFGPTVVWLRDGPRSPTGRIYTPVLWHQWQRSVAEGMRHLDGFAASVQPGETVVAVSSQFNADHYLRLRLLQNGYDIVPISQDPAACRGMDEIFRKGDRTVIHIRSEAPYGIAEEWEHIPGGYLQQFQVAEEIRCLQLVPFERAALIDWEDVPGFFLPALDATLENRPPWQRSYPGTHSIPTLRTAHFGEVNIQPLTPPQMAALQQSAQTAVRLSAQTANSWKPLSSYAELHSIYRWRFGDADRIGASR